MNDLIQDILHDLKQKRLWPVAAVLALAVLAVPVVLLKSSDPQSATATPSPPASGAVSTAQAVEVGGKSSSDLGSFKSKNPFKPGVKPPKDLSSAVAGLQSTPAGAGAQAPSGTGTSGGGGGVTTPTSPTTPTRRTVTYTYVADVTFGRLGHTHDYRSVRKLQMLPNEESPLLVFLGATSNGDDAVFLVDQSLDQAGEGKCSDSACSMLALGVGSEHRFTDTAGNDYLLRINEIRKTRVSKGSKAARASRVKKSAKASTSAGAKDTVARAFVSALLSDGQTLTSTDAGSSSSGGEGR